MPEIMNQIILSLVSLLGGAIIGVIGSYIKSRRGNRVIVARDSETPQINITEGVQQSLEILYKGQPVKNIVLNSLRIYNNGDDIIEPLKIKLVVDPESDNIEYLEVEETDPLERTSVSKEEGGFEISRPYINPRKKFKEEEIKLAIFSNTTLKVSAHGGGKGWYAKYEDTQRERRRSYRWYSILLLFVGFGSFIFSILSYVNSASLMCWPMALMGISVMVFLMNFMLQKDK